MLYYGYLLLLKGDGWCFFLFSGNSSIAGALHEGQEHGRGFWELRTEESPKA
jgi:hypothetical protein